MGNLIGLKGNNIDTLDTLFQKTATKGAQMKSIEITYLSLPDIIKTNLSNKEAIKIVEGSLSEHGKGQFENPPKPGIHTLPDSFIHAMPAWLPGKKIAGMKWVAGYSSNPKNGLPMITGLIVLNDPKTGFPFCIMDGAYITALRTAAVSGVSVKYLARQDSETVGLVGAGVQGRYHLLFLKEVLKKLKTVKVFETNKTILSKFIKDIQPMVPFKIEIANSAEEAIRNSDIVITATGVLGKPIFKEKWIKQKGILVLPVHSKGWEGKALMSADKFLVDDWQQFSTVLGHKGGYYWPVPKLHAQLGEVVIGKKAGRENDDERIVNTNFGMAIHDIAMATVILKRAQKLGLGKTLTLGNGKLPNT